MPSNVNKMSCLPKNVQTVFMFIPHCVTNHTFTPLLSSHPFLTHKRHLPKCQFEWYNVYTILDQNVMMIIKLKQLHSKQNVWLTKNVYRQFIFIQTNHTLHIIFPPIPHTQKEPAQIIHPRTKHAGPRH